LLYNPALDRYDPEVLERLGLALEQLPDLISPRLAARGLTAEVSRVTGLPAGIPVSAAIHDQYTAALGTGAVHPGTTMIGAGTAWVLLAVSGQPVKAAVPNAFVNRHVVEGLYGQIMSLVNGGSALAWAAQLVGVGAGDTAEIDRLLETAPPGCDGVRLWPFLAPSSAAGVPPGTQGRWSGLQLSHGRAHLIRSVVEGLAFELKRHLSFIHRAGIPVEKLVMGGTAAASRVTPQLLADVTGLPLGCLEHSSGSLLGACIIARGLQEPKRSLSELAEEMLPPAKQIQPGPNAAPYAKLFEQYFESLPMESM
jgi:sugar (pentulose or hexulose) kinase